MLNSILLIQRIVSFGGTVVWMTVHVCCASTGVRRCERRRPILPHCTNTYVLAKGIKFLRKIKDWEWCVVGWHPAPVSVSCDCVALGECFR